MLDYFNTGPFLADLAVFAITANVSVVSLNLSLMLNPVGYYQVSV